MTFEIDVAGARHRVTVEPVGSAGRDGGRFRLTVHAPDAEGTRTIEVEARRSDLGLSLVYADGRSVDAALTEAVRGELVVGLPRATVQATIDGRRFHRSDEGSAGEGEQRILAPMPGRIVRVLVKPGDPVSARQGIVVVEAMKMENELVAVREGTVREIAVAEGASVEAGRLLAVIV